MVARRGSASGLKRRFVGQSEKPGETTEHPQIPEFTIVLYNGTLLLCLTMWNYTKLSHCVSSPIRLTAMENFFFNEKKKNKIQQIIKRKSWNNIYICEGFINCKIFSENMTLNTSTNLIITQYNIYYTQFIINYK